MSKERKFLRCDNPIMWGIFASLMIVVFGAWLANRKDCTDTICIEKYSQFLALPPNGVGDTLAGFAGALALVWIVVTLMVQQMEIAASKEQAEKTASALEAQKVYFQAATAREEVNALVASLAASLPNYEFKPAVLKLKGGDEISFAFISEKFLKEDYEKLPDFEKLHRSAAVDKGVRRKIEDAVRLGKIEKGAAARWYYEVLHGQFNALVELIDIAPRDRQVILKRCRVKEHLAYLEFLLNKKEIWRPDEVDQI